MKQKIDWRRYQNSLIPDCTPDSDICVSKFAAFCKCIRYSAFFARWTTDFDCSKKTAFWYVIKDKFISIDLLPAKNRSEINRGLKNCVVRKVSADDVAVHGYSVYAKAIASYSGVRKGKLLSPEQYSRAVLSTLNNSNVDWFCVFDKIGNKVKRSITSSSVISSHPSLIP